MTTIERSSTSSSGSVVVQSNGTPSVVTTRTDVSSGSSAHSTMLHTPKNVEAAVYGYIQSLRNLKKTRVNSLDIARALSLPISDVEVAMRRLSDKGVRVIG